MGCFLDHLGKPENKTFIQTELFYNVDLKWSSDETQRNLQMPPTFIFNDPSLVGEPCHDTNTSLWLIKLIEPKNKHCSNI